MLSCFCIFPLLIVEFAFGNKCRLCISVCKHSSSRWETKEDYNSTTGLLLVLISCGDLVPRLTTVLHFIISHVPRGQICKYFCIFHTRQRANDHMHDCENSSPLRAQNCYNLSFSESKSSKNVSLMFFQPPFQFLKWCHMSQCTLPLCNKAGRADKRHGPLPYISCNKLQCVHCNLNI